MSTSEKYVAAAYLVVLGIVLLYVVIYAFKMSRLSREVAELAELAAGRSRESREDAGAAVERAGVEQAG